MAFDLSKLGVVKNIPKINFLEYTGIIEAQEKWGKTTIAALYPNAVLLAFEIGFKAQVVNAKVIPAWDDLVEFIDLLEENREDIGDSIQTIVFDTAEEAYGIVAPYVVRKQSIKDKTKYNEIKDIPFGAGYGLVDQEFKRQVKRILSMGFTILYLTHSKVKNIKPKNGEPYDIYVATMPDRCAQIIYPACDYIIRGERRAVEDEHGDKKNVRAMIVKGSDDGVTGNRANINVDIEFDTEEEAMEKFQDLFRKSIEANIRKAGIKTDISVLEEQQKKEREAEVKKYIESVSGAKGLIAQLDDLVTGLTPENKKAVISEFKKILGNNGNYKVIEDEVLLQKCIDFISGLV
jgi:hypothetical protein